VNDRDQLALYLGALWGTEPAGAWGEVRYKRERGGMGQMFLPVAERQASFDAILRLGRQTDVYVGVLPRTERRGGKDAIERGHVLYVDADTPESITALESFTPRPSMIVASGSGRHAYWSLWPPAGIEAIERANRRLAHALGADSACVDAARILRPPGTFNHKSEKPKPVTIEHVEIEVYELAEVVGHLPDPASPAAPERARARSRPTDADDVVAALRAVPPPEYVERLSGRRVAPDGKARCPLHDDHGPSLHAYPDPEQGWTCFGSCEGSGGKRNGGDVFSFAAQLWHLDPRANFLALRERLAAELLGEPA